MTVKRATPGYEATRDGGAAFPIPNATDMDGYVYAPEARGMSKREYIAAAVLAGMAANPNANQIAGLAVEAVRAADALLRALSEAEQPI